MGATERGWRERAAGQGRRGETPRPLSLHWHPEGIRQAPLPSPGRGHKLLLEPTHPQGFLLGFPGGEMEGLTTPLYHRAN